MARPQNRLKQNIAYRKRQKEFKEQEIQQINQRYSDITRTLLELPEYTGWVKPIQVEITASMQRRFESAGFYKKTQKKSKFVPLTGSTENGLVNGYFCFNLLKNTTLLSPLTKIPKKYYIPVQLRGSRNP